MYKVDLDVIKGIVCKCAGVSTWKQEYMRRKASQMKGGTYMVLDRVE